MVARVTEYRDWAIGLRKAGSDITGEKLAPESLDLGAAGAPASPFPLGGYFVFSAKDPAAALEMRGPARTSGTAAAPRFGRSRKP